MLKNILFIILCFGSINSVLSQHDTLYIDVDVPGITKKGADKKSKIKKSKTKDESLAFALDAMYLIKLDSIIRLGYAINGNVWVFMDTAEIISIEKDGLITYSGIKVEDFKKISVPFIKDEQFELSFFAPDTLIRSLNLTKALKPENALLILIHVDEGEALSSENISFSNYNVSLKWEENKATITEDLELAGLNVLGGLVIQKILIDDANDLRPGISYDADSSFPLGVWQFQVVGVFLQKEDEIKVIELPSDSSSFKSSSKATSANKKPAKKNRRK